MARVLPLRGLRYDPAHCDLAGVLAPPYDVIAPALQEELYGHDLRNIVRIDYGKELPGDSPGVDDRYTRAAGHLRSWVDLGVLRRDPRPSLYIHDHDFDAVDGRRLTRRGVFCRVPALPWERSEVLPHERTLRGPKEDRLSLMRATRTQTSAVFAMWDGAPGITEALAAATDREPDVTGWHDGEIAREDDRLWVVDDPAQVAAVVEALAPARLYIADGHHRFETAAAYAEERRSEEPDAPDDADFALTLLYLSAADDPTLDVLPTHRLVRPAAGVPATLAALTARLDDGFSVEPRPALADAQHDAAAMRSTHHAFAVAARDGAALVHARRGFGGSPRARLDVTVLHERVLDAACGLDADRVAGGALAYTRDVAEAEQAVVAGEAALALCLNGCTTAEIVAVSDAGETMPQKSTYFYPKVPTGLVLSPL